MMYAVTSFMIFLLLWTCVVRGYSLWFGTLTCTPEKQTQANWVGDA